MASGVYAIVNTATGKVYIGSSASLSKRQREHFSDLSRGVHHSVKLQRSFDKHGAACFEFTVIEECPVSDLLVREQVAIDAFDSWRGGYNTAKFAAAPGRGRVNTPEHRAAISAAQRGRVPSPDTCELLRQSRLGRAHTAETRAKIAAANRRRPSKKHSPATIAKMRAARLLYWAQQAVPKKLSLETRAKMRVAALRRWERVAR